MSPLSDRILMGPGPCNPYPEAVAACDQAVSIPMHGFTQSFNLSVSVALSIHRLAERRRGALGQAGDLGDQKRAHLRARWYAVGIRGAKAIVSRYAAGTPRPVL